jgi:S-formylglutathione hydrolase FrmB
MAFTQIDFYSESLKRTVTFNALIPNDLMEFMKKDNKYYERPMKTLYLLHGYSASNKDWLFGSRIQELSLQYNLAVIFPTGENSFYVDASRTDAAFGTFVGKELVEYTRKLFRLSEKREDTFIGGLSMGGFGAIRNGLKYSETFGKIVGLSSALIIHNIKNKTEGFVDGIADYYYYTSVFGSLDKLEESDNNPETIINNLIKEEKDIPGIYMACGTEDFLIQENRVFQAFLQSKQVKVDYIEDAGVHDWDFWNRYLEPSIQWLIDYSN